MNWPFIAVMVGLAVIFVVALAWGLREKNDNSTDELAPLRLDKLPERKAPATKQPELIGQDADLRLPRLHWLIRYTDAKAVITERNITLMRARGRFNENGDPVLKSVFAVCHQRGGLRVFRLDRIVWAADAETGEVIENVPRFIAGCAVPDERTVLPPASKQAW